jgi:hypothetical protein
VKPSRLELRGETVTGEPGEVLSADVARPEASPLLRGLDQLRQAAAQIPACRSAEDRDQIFERLSTEPVLGEIITAAAMEPVRIDKAIQALIDAPGFSGRGKQLQHIVTAELKAAQDISGSNNGTLSDILPPRAAEKLSRRSLALQLPSGYRLINSSVCKVNPLTGTAKLVSRYPLIITASSTNEATGTRDLTLSWWESQGLGRWFSVTVPRDNALDSRKLIQWAYHGLPVAADTVKEVTSYFHAFEVCNAGNLPRGETVVSLGWWPASTDPTDYRAFILPDEVIGDAPGVNLVVPPGLDKITKQIHAKGTYSDWLKVFDIAKQFPLIYMPLYASIASVLIPGLGVHCFTLDLSEASGAGKTTATQLGVSTWGKPSVGNGLIRSWDDRQVFSERAAGILGNLPLYQDETKRAQDPDLVARFTYEFWQGEGRGRGVPGAGAQSTASWHSVMVSTGEGPISGLTAGLGDRHEGLRARVVELRGRPTGRECEANRDAAEAIEAILLANYGHLGPDVVDLLVEEQESVWVYLQERYQIHLRQLRTHKSVKHSAIAGRVTAYIASMMTAAELIHDNFDVTRPDRDPFRFVLDSAVGGGNVTPRHLKLLMRFRQWLVSNQHRFWGRHNTKTVGSHSRVDVPRGGWAGIWSSGSEWDHLMIMEDKLAGLFFHWRVNKDEIIRAWLAAGYITDAAGKLSTEADLISGVTKDPVCIASVRGIRVPCYRITRAAVEGAEEA